MDEKYLPIGTVVLLENGTKELMITLEISKEDLEKFIEVAEKLKENMKKEGK